jgi:CRISPR-associated protein Cmr5
MPSRQQTLDQRRAKRAWEDVQEAKVRSSDFKKKYGGLARRVPMLVLTNGLGQTLAFLQSKRKKAQNGEHTLLYRQLSVWTMGEIAVDSEEKDLLSWILQTDSAAYRRATVEALAYLGWLKRFAEAELPTDEGER